MSVEITAPHLAIETTGQEHITDELVTEGQLTTNELCSLQREQDEPLNQSSEQQIDTQRLRLWRLGALALTGTELKKLRLT